MSEANDDITNQPNESPRRRDISGEPPRGDEAYEEDRLAPPPKKSNVGLIASLGGGVVVILGIVGVAVVCCGCLGAVLLIPAVAKVREAAARTQSQNNLKQIGLAMHSCSDAMGGELPPSNGPYPGNQGPNGSFFFHVLPYVEEANLYNLAQFSQPMPDVPVKVYVAPADQRNAGINSTISYCTNGTVFLNKPHMPRTFINGTSNSICVMERSGLDGAHKWINTNNVLGAPGNPPSFPQIDVAPATYQEGSPQGYSSAGCAVLLADGSVRLITTKRPSATTWKWACDPTTNSPAPPDW